jgi:TM2 domain-containing membrane protein YozV
MTERRGKVASYDDALARGMISGDDGRQYVFTRGDLTGGVRYALPGEEVLFSPTADEARDVMILPSASPTSKSKWIAALCAIVGGWFGLHKFYLGRGGAGVLSAVFFWTGIPFLIAMVEIVIYLTKDDETFHEDYEVDRRAWF